MQASPGPLTAFAAMLALFVGGAAVGTGLAGALAPGSWVAQAVSFFALPVAFATGLQAWYGVALLSLIPRLLGGRRSTAPGSPEGPSSPKGTIPGSLVFVPLSSGAGAIAGIVAGVMSSTRPALPVALAYWLVGTVHGAVAWRLARAGHLLPPEST